MRNPEPTAGADREIVLQNPNRYPEAQARRLRPWLERLIQEIAPQAQSLGIRFSGDREMRRTNRQFRGKDTTTDVLSFPGEEGHLGDILISVPTARRQAGSVGHPVERELKVLLLHGVLHCLGYDHETDQGEMERLEHRLRRRFLRAGDAGGEAHV
jgi:probable rRNA maturation factor